MDSIITRFYYRDTIAEYIYRADLLVFDREGGCQNFGFKDSLVVYDENGYVIELYQIVYEGNNPSARLKYLITNDETGKIYEITQYIKEAGELHYEEYVTVTDYTWKEWHGFALTNVVTSNGELRSPYPKRNKEESSWVKRNGDTIGFYQKWWDLDSFESNTDTFYYYIDGHIYPQETYSVFYNEYGDYTSVSLAGWLPPDEFGFQHQTSYVEYRYEYQYEEPFGKKEEKIYVINGNNSQLSYRLIKDFSFVKIPELGAPDRAVFCIAPNPATGQTKITAQEDIHCIELFDLTGRLLKVETINNRAVVISLRGCLNFIF